MLAAEHLLDLAGVDLGLELVEPAGQIIVHRLPRLEPLGEHGQIVGAARQRGGKVDVVFETATTLLNFLGLRLVLPEVRVGSADIELLELVGRSCSVKDNSAERRTA
jgi:hypothetical protein